MIARRLLRVLAAGAVTMAVCSSSARAEHRASRATYDAIDKVLRPSARTIDDHLASVEVSSKGPYALALERGGQGYRALMKYRSGRWRAVADVSDATGLRCDVAPAAVFSDLHLLRYVSSHRCFG